MFAFHYKANGIVIAIRDQHLDKNMNFKTKKTIILRFLLLLTAFITKNTLGQNNIIIVHGKVRSTSGVILLP